MTIVNEKESKEKAKALRIATRNAINSLKTFKAISTKNSNVVFSQDAYAKELGKLNQTAMNRYETTSYVGKTKEKLEDVIEILFRNFEIFNANHEMIKAYTDEYYDRFLTLEKSLNAVLIRLDAYLEQEVR